jgi:hypothetical protein
MRQQTFYKILLQFIILIVFSFFYQAPEPSKPAIVHHNLAINP